MWTTIYTCRVDWSFWVYYRIAVGAPLLRPLLWKWTSVSAWIRVCWKPPEMIIQIRPRWKWTPKCHTLWDSGSLWDVCRATSPVGWNNHAWGISWLSWRRAMAEEGGLHSRIPIPHRWGLAYPCRTSPSCQVLAPEHCCILLQMNNPVKGTNVLQKSHWCPACFLLTDIHL